MVARWHEGYEVVYAQRRTRAGETLAKRVVSAVGYRVIKRISDVEIPANTGDFRLMSRRVVDNVVALREEHGFLRGLVALVGFKQTSVLYDRDARASGDGKYNRFFGSLVIGMNGIVGFSRYPLHLISSVGVDALAVLGAADRRLSDHEDRRLPVPDRQPDDRDPDLLLQRIQLLSLGVMAEYVGRIYDEVKRRPRFILESSHGIERLNAPERERVTVETVIDE